MKSKFVQFYKPMFISTMVLIFASWMICSLTLAISDISALLDSEKAVKFGSLFLLSACGLLVLSSVGLLMLLAHRASVHVNPTNLVACAMICSYTAWASLKLNAIYSLCISLWSWILVPYLIMSLLYCLAKWVWPDRIAFVGRFMSF